MQELTLEATPYCEEGIYAVWGNRGPEEGYYAYFATQGYDRGKASYRAMSYTELLAYMREYFPSMRVVSTEEFIDQTAR